MLIHSLRRVLSFPIARIVSLIVYNSVLDSRIGVQLALPAFFFVFIGVLVCPHNTRKVVVVFSVLGLVCSGGTGLLMDYMAGDSTRFIAAAIARGLGLALGVVASIMLQNYRLKRDSLNARSA
jgi:hypothetical protein